MLFAVELYRFFFRVFFFSFLFLSSGCTCVPGSVWGFCGSPIAKITFIVQWLFFCSFPFLVLLPIRPSPVPSLCFFLTLLALVALSSLHLSSDLKHSALVPSLFVVALSFGFISHTVGTGERSSNN